MTITVPARSGRSAAMPSPAGLRAPLPTPARRRLHQLGTAPTTPALRLLRHIEQRPRRPPDHARKRIPPAVQIPGDKSHLPGQLSAHSTAPGRVSPLDTHHGPRPPGSAGVRGAGTWPTPTIGIPRTSGRVFGARPPGSRVWGGGDSPLGRGARSAALGPRFAREVELDIVMEIQIEDFIISIDIKVRTGRLRVGGRVR